MMISFSVPAHISSVNRRIRCSLSWFNGTRHTGRRPRSPSYPQGRRRGDLPYKRIGSHGTVDCLVYCGYCRRPHTCETSPGLDPNLVRQRRETPPGGFPSLFDDSCDHCWTRNRPTRSQNVTSPNPLVGLLVSHRIRRNCTTCW